MLAKDFEKLVIRHIRREANFHKSILVMAGAQIQSDYKIACNKRETSKNPFVEYYDKRMQRKMKRLGTLGKQPKNNDPSRNYIGNCAEQHACNELLISRNDDRDKLSKVHLSKAYNPRTILIVKPCGNCKFIFNIHD